MNLTDNPDERLGIHEDIQENSSQGYYTELSFMYDSQRYPFP